MQWYLFKELLWKTSEQTLLSRVLMEDLYDGWYYMKARCGASVYHFEKGPPCPSGGTNSPSCDIRTTRFMRTRGTSR
jgi:hypothetical protein